MTWDTSRPNPKIFYEPQWGKNENGFWFTITISRYNHTWTSRPAHLCVADEEQAKEEIARQLNALRKVLEGK